MDKHLEQLRRRHRRIDRLIDTTKRASRQEDLKILKRIRLRLRDRITSLQRNRTPVRT